MIQNASSPPQTTFADIPAGQAFFAPIGVGIDCIKTSESPARAINLQSGAPVTIAPTDVVTAAPNATYTMWP